MILPALSADSVDVGFSNLASVVFYEQNVGELRMLSGGTFMDSEFSEAGLVALKDKGIENLSDLSGKSIAVNTKKNIVALAVIRALRKAGLQSDDINLVELPFKDMEAALLAGRIDAAALPEPLVAKITQNQSVLNLGDHFALAFDELYATGFLCTEEQFQQKKNAYTRFNLAIEEATPIANRFDQEVVAAISSTTKVPIALIESAGRPKFEAQIPDEAISKMKSWLKEEGFLE